MSTPPDKTTLSVTDFTNAVAPLVDFLKEKYKDEPFRISDVWDDPKFLNPSLNLSHEDECRQYVDLVQEGGGVHGIALSGFTYMLEKMGISFMKMAGTSAGAINTMLLSCLSTKREAIILGLDPNINYYETRSEKLLEYLAAKPLTDLVDGEPRWKKLLLRLFSGDVSFKPIKNYAKSIMLVLLGFIGGALLISIISLLFFFITDEYSEFHSILKWISRLSALVIFVSFLYLVLQVIKVVRLRLVVKKYLGINEGKDFESWLEDCMKRNNIHNVKDLSDKLTKEEAMLHYSYEPLILFKETEDSDFESNAGLDVSPQLKTKIANPEFSIANVKEFMQEEKRKSNSVFESTNPEAEFADVIPSAEVQFAFAVRTSHLMFEKGIHKEIVIVTADILNEIKVEFPGMHKMYFGNDNQISPARYVRASMSIPLFFRPLPVNYDEAQSTIVAAEWQKLFNVQKAFKKANDVALFVDGGLLSNFPVNVFYNPEMPLPSRPTIGIKLEYEDENVTKSNITSLGGLFGSLVSTMRFFYDRDFLNKHNMYKKTVRSIDTGSIHWLNFNLSDENKIELFFRGALTAAIFLGKVKKATAELQTLKEYGKRVPLHGKRFLFLKRMMILRQKTC
jgi:predicted acylesterase/phospholipase RssA